MRTIQCKRCCGTGRVGNYAHVKSGVCFACDGTGVKRVTRMVEVEKQYGVVVYDCGGESGLMSVSCAQMTADNIEGATVKIVTKISKQRVAA